MSIYISIFMFLMSAAWAFFSGAVEAILYSMRGYDAFKGNEHNYFTVQRLTVVALIILSYIITKYVNEVSYILILFSLLLSWNFFHDAGYYETRRRIDVINYRWYTSAVKGTNSAKINISFKLRLLGLIAGVLVLIVSML